MENSGAKGAQVTRRHAWILATVGLCSVEIIASLARDQSSTPPQSRSEKLGPLVHASAMPAGVDTPQPEPTWDVADETWLVVGNPGSPSGSPVRVRLSMIDHSVENPHGQLPVQHGQVLNIRTASLRKVVPITRPTGTGSILAPPRPIGAAPSQPAETSQGESSVGRARTFFLPLRNGPPHPAPLTCIPLRSNSFITVLAESSLVADPTIADLAGEIATLFTASFGAKLIDLAGPVVDRDGDGRLAIVITTALEAWGSPDRPVEGLTRSTDFERGANRPESNQADVIFLSHRIRRGSQLRAVLAHEFCHAAVFGRVADASPSQGRVEGWLNEALAHVVETRAAETDSNLRHRIDAFAARPLDAPLRVVDMGTPRYWRHDGCRGAGFLFLNWCDVRSSGTLVRELRTASALTTVDLERLTGTPFEELFREWTVSLGQGLLDDVNIDRDRQPDLRDSHSDQAVPANQSAPVRVSFAEWDVTKSTDYELSVAGTTAAYLRIRFAGRNEQAPGCGRRTQGPCGIIGYSPDAAVQVTRVAR